ncbi:SprT family zinc-dependent metalloprotease [uncultured Tissierella sp.]|uniref:M48 family metallopeptidase n=1 Tax=uncultured Tissierella sp. TaxID=448160 RepID=UPI002806082F|nr:SprT family zinc-dependent metalloprotease [uncultured Tissierella sp.]MDU5082735.1 SprT family zinc-dependent metalloprotease [Bacillota bacterium]
MAQCEDIHYELRQSKRKTLSIYIERDGSVTVLAPEHLNMEEIEKVLEEKRYWIYSKQEEWKYLNSAKVKRQFVNGEGFLYLGRSYRLKLVDEQDEPLKLYQGYFCLRKKDIPFAAEHFKEFYRTKGTMKLKDRVDHYKDMIGVKPQGIRVMELKYRWASYSNNDILNFHWKLMMAPMTIIDYVVVHELVHFLYPNHTESFWNVVDKVLPDYLERKNWLREEGAALDI